MNRWTGIGLAVLLGAWPFAVGAQSTKAAPEKAATGAAASGMSRADYVNAAVEHSGKLAGRRFDRMDAEHKGSINREQYVKYYEARSKKFAQRRFEMIDTNHDGVLEPSEIAAWKAAHKRTSRHSAALPEK